MLALCGCVQCLFSAGILADVLWEEREPVILVYSDTGISCQIQLQRTLGPAFLFVRYQFCCVSWNLRAGDTNLGEFDIGHTCENRHHTSCLK